MHAPVDNAARASAGWKSFFTRQPQPWEGLAIGIVLSLLAALPVLVASLPQMADYGSHLARYHIMLDGGRNPFLAQYYEFNWRWTGNVGVDLLIWPVARIFELEPGARLIVMMIPPLTGLSIMTVEWTLRRRIGAGSLLAFALIWTPALLLGFLNFCLSLALALFAFALWVKLEGRRWRPLLFLPISMAVWAAHLCGWGVLGVMVFGYELHRQRNFRAFLAPWPLLPPVIPLLAGGGTKGLLAYGKVPLLHKFWMWAGAMRDQLKLFDMVSVVLILVIAVLALRGRRIDYRVGIAAALLALLSLALPRHLGGGDFLDNRLVGVALLAALLAIDVPGPRWLLWMAPALFLVRLGVTTDAWRDDSRDEEAMMAIVGRIPEGARVAGAVAVDLGDWAANPHQHTFSYATTRRDALVNSHFALPDVHMLRLKQGGPGFADPSHRLLLKPGKAPDLSAFPPARHADWLWYIGELEPVRLPPGAKVVYRTHDSFLARLAKPFRGG